MQQADKKPIKKSGLEATGRSFSRGWRRLNGGMLLGFALCQCWVTLCFFTPQLFPDNGSTRVYELSLIISTLALIPGVIYARRFESVVDNRRALWLMAAGASLGTLIIPFSGTDTFVEIAVMITAARLTGFARGWLSVVWYRAFCLANDNIGFALSVATQSLIIYVLTSVVLPPTFSPWIMMTLSCLMPLASVYLLLKSPRMSFPITAFTLSSLTHVQKQVLLRLCLGMFVVSFVDEFMRNYYLDGSDLAFYADTVNLVILVLKVVCSVGIVAALVDSGRRISLIYKASFLLTMMAVLFMPYLNYDAGYGVTNFGAFFFKIAVMLVAFTYCRRYRISPVLTFSLTRITWSLDLFLGVSAFHTCSIMEDSIPNLLGIVSVILGLLVVATYLFVMADEKGAYAIIPEEEPSEQHEAHETLDERCDRLVQAGGLSKRESEVLRLIARGRSTPRIQEELHLAANTVNTHTSHIYQKLGVHSKQELLDLVEET